MSKMSAPKIGLSMLFYTGVASIMGSGWLMSPALLANDAGPSSILSWIIGALIIATISVSFIEVCGLFPARNGGFGHYIDYTNNSFLSFIVDWVFAISWISLIPAEADATVSYLSKILPGNIVVENIHGSYNMTGLIIISVVCTIFFIINYISFDTLLKCVKSLTLIKIIVPIIVIMILYAKTYSVNNFTSNAFIPYGNNSFLEAIVTKGVVFAFIGFQTPVTFAAIANNPKKNIPRAIILSIIFCVIIYTLLQIVYIGAVPVDEVRRLGGWKGVLYDAPFSAIAKLHHINILLPILSLIAFIAPFGSGLVFFASSSRIIVEFNHYLPMLKADSHKDSLSKSTVFVLVLSLLIIWFLPSWKMVVSVACESLIILFMIICLCNGIAHKFMLEEKKLYGIIVKFSSIFTMLGFCFSSMMYVWGGWPLTWQAIIVIIVGIPFYIYYHCKHESVNFVMNNILKSSWVIIFLSVLSLISYLGHIHYIKFYLLQAITFSISFVVYVINLVLIKRPNEKMRGYILSIGK